MRIPCAQQQPDARSVSQQNERVGPSQPSLRTFRPPVGRAVNEQFLPHTHAVWHDHRRVCRCLDELPEELKCLP